MKYLYNLKFCKYNFITKNQFKKSFFYDILCRKYGISVSSRKPVYENAIKYWDKIATEDINGKYAYRDIYCKSSQLSESLEALLGKHKQQRIALLLPNDVSYIISQWAAWKVGHIVVPLHATHPESQLKYYVEDSKSSLIITNGELAAKFSSFLAGKQVIVLDKFLPFSDDEKQSNCLKPEENLYPQSDEEKSIQKDSSALMIYTSGTTGPPKGVVLTHGNIQSQVQSINTAWELTSNDVLLHCLPLNHVHGIVNALLCPLYCGAKVVMEPHFSASSVWSKLLNLNPEVSSRVNLLMAVPTIYAKLIDEYETSFVNDNRKREFVKKVCLENVRLMVSGSAPLPEPLLQKWRQITGHTLLERYGMTEIGMALTNPLKGERIPGFVGKPFPGVRVKVARFSPKRDSYETLCEGTHEDTSVAPGFKGEAGELLVKGPNVFREYWQREEATKKEFTKDGWFCTGDTAAYIDGSYKILGRTSVDIIKSGGFKVSALDVERQLLSHPGIVDVAVVGVPDMTWGEKIGCVVVWKGEPVLDLATLREWAKERLPHYQVPSALTVLPDALPRNNMGKVNKKELLNQYFKKT